MADPVNFVSRDSIVRTIWGNADSILFIFAGAAAEFALNKAVDWLFFTGRLPADPLGRLFSTVSYARQIVFSTEHKANAVIDSMAQIHRDVESKRGAKIPDWAYRDVLYMLIDYSIRSYELLHRRLSTEEKREVYDVFRRVGTRMEVPLLPDTYELWSDDRQAHLERDLEKSEYTVRLYQQYRKHLGIVRYTILRSAQSVLVPKRIRHLLMLSRSGLFLAMLRGYKVLVKVRLDWPLKKMILPARYIGQVKELQQV
jgi:uncharacterized protein (DUF2236 family)